MSTQLSLFCNRIIEAGWLVALIVVPLHFNPLSSEAFEPDKIALLRSIALIMALAWAIKGVLWRAAGRQPRDTRSVALSDPETRSLSQTLARHPLVVLAMLLLLIYGLATGLSILPRVSIWGYHARLYGLYTLTAYLTIFFSLLALLRTRDQVERLITTTLLVSIPIVLYSLTQQFEADPLGWQNQATGRAHSTMGNPIFLGATLSMVVPLTLYRLIEALQSRHRLLQLCYGTLLALQFDGILITQSRGPVMGLAAALLFGSLLWTLTRHQWRAAKAIAATSLTLIAFLILINLPNTPFGFVEDVPYLNRLTQVDNVEGSAEGRLLIWKGAIDLIGADPARWVLGYGPETIRFAYYPHYSADLGHIHGWEVFFDRMHNETLDVIITTGWGGFMIYLLFFTALAYYSLRWTGLLPFLKHRAVFLALWAFAGLCAPLILRLTVGAWTYSGVALALGLLGGLFLYLTGYAFFASRQTNQPPPFSSSAVLLMVVLFSGLLGHFIEINVGIAISATRLLFWVYTALLLMVGLLFRHQAEPEPTSETPHCGTRAPKARSLCLGLMMATLALSLSVQGVSSDSLLVIGSLLILTGGLAALLVIAETRAATTTPFSPKTTGRLAGLSLLPLLLVSAATTAGVHTGNAYLFFYYGLVLLVIVGVASVLHPPSSAPVRKTPYWAYGLVLTGILGVGVLIDRTNVQVIQANMQHQLAQDAYRQNRYDLAITHYQSALAYNPTQEAYQLELAQVMATKASRLQTPAERDRLFEKAERLLMQAARNNPFEQYHPAALGAVYRSWAKTTADPHRRAERYEDALAAYHRATQINQENVLIGQQRAALHEETGNRPQALAAYRQLLTWDSTNASLYLQLGMLHREEQQWQQAASMYEGVIRHSTQPIPATHVALALLYHQLGREEEAVTQSQRAIELDPDVVVYREILMGLYQSMGRCDEAQEEAHAALERWPDHDTLTADLALLQQQCR